MSSVVISGDTSGAVTLAAPAVAGTNTLTLLAATATNSVNVLATAVASTSGTSITFSSLPSWVKKITVMFSGISTSGTSNYLVQLGDSGGVEITGYVAYCTIVGTTTSAAASTAGFIFSASVGAADVWYGAMTITNVTGNDWVATSMINSTGGNRAGSGGKSLSGTLDRVVITTVNGTDTFDLGTVNILYEG